ncbi:MAG: hypothetical protein FWG83_06125 [Oscillospiraceae bacterium]|nr:hypothetical protein [Oscillospiraceae bacterium]
MQNQAKKTNVGGLILLLVGTIVTGALLSQLYQFVQPIVTEWDVRFAIFAALLFGLFAGAISGLMVGFFKVTNFKAAMAMVVIGCIGFSYFKWAMFLSKDAEKMLFSEEYGAYFYCLVTTSDFCDENGKLLPQRELREIIDTMQNTTELEYAQNSDFWHSIEPNWNEFSRTQTYYAQWYSELFGYSASGAVSRIEEAFEEMSIFIYYRIMHETDGDVPSATYFMTNPGDMFKVIGAINEEGRWIYDNDQISGVFYAFIWIVEFLLICVPAIAVTYNKVKQNDVTGFTEVTPEESGRIYESVSNVPVYGSLYDERTNQGMEAVGTKTLPPLPAQLTPTDENGMGSIGRDSLQSNQENTLESEPEPNVISPMANDRFGDWN